MEKEKKMKKLKYIMENTKRVRSVNNDYEEQLQYILRVEIEWRNCVAPSWEAQFLSTLFPPTT